MNDVRLSLESIQRLADVLSVQLAQGGVVDVVEQCSCEDALIAREVDGFEEWRAVDVISSTPRAIYPVCSRLQDVVLEIVLVLQQQSYALGLLGKLLQTPEVPLVQRCEVVLRQTVPCQRPFQPPLFRGGFWISP